MREDWVIVKLREFAAHEKGKKPKNQKAKQDEVFKYPYVNIEAFEKGIIETYTDGDKCNFCFEDDFLMVWDGSRSGLVGKGMNGALGSTLVRINFPGIENNYAYHFLSSKYQEINTRAKGSGTPHVDPYLLWNYDFPICSLSEQRAIVSKIESLFSDLDKGIEDLNKAKDQLKVYRQAVLKKAFEGELTKEWREKQSNLQTAEELLAQMKLLREKWIKSEIENGKNEAKRIKSKLQNLNSVFPEDPLPETWLWTNFINGCQFVIDCHNKTAPYTDSGIYLVRTTNIRDGKLNLKEGIKYVSQATYEYWSKRVYPEPGDLIFTREAPMGEAAIIPLNIKICLGQRTMLLRTNESCLNNKYLLYNILSEVFQQRFKKSAIGTGVKHLRVGDVETLAFPLCSLTEQNQIVKEIESRLSVCDQVEKSINDSLVKAKALRQSILKKAFEGSLLSQSEIEKCKAEPDYEPASVLLARIKQSRNEQIGKEKKNKLVEN